MVNARHRPSSIVARLQSVALSAASASQTQTKPWPLGGTPLPPVPLPPPGTIGCGQSVWIVGGVASALSAALPVALGISKHPGGVLESDGRAGWMRVWEPLENGQSGNLGCAVVLASDVRGEVKQGDTDYLLVAPWSGKGPLVYYVGSAWDRAGGVADAAAWTKEVRALAARAAAPLKVKLAAAGK